MCAERDTEFPFYLERLKELKKAGADIWSSAGNTQKSLEKIREFAKSRGAYITEDLEEYFEIELE